MKRKMRRNILCLIGLTMVLSLNGCMDDTDDKASVHEEAENTRQTIALDLEQINEFHELLESGRAQADSAPIATAVKNNSQNESVQSEDGVSEDTESTLLEASYGYAYSTLRENEQIWYRDIAECLGEMEEEITLDKKGIEMGMDETDIDKIFQCVLMDHPELFYVEGYSYTKYNRRDKLLALRFSGNYSMNRKQAEARKTEIDEAVEVLLSNASHLLGDYDKVLYVYEAIIKNTVYDLDSSDNQNIYSVFVNHRSVCQGYAKAVQYLLNRMGVECMLVQGTVDTGEGHAWNLVKVNSRYYYVDATWGDASYRSEDGSETGGQVPDINYDYLCITTDQLMRTHILDSLVPMPMCVDVRDNYYVREGAYFTGYDEMQMQALFTNAYAEQRPEVTIKCSDFDCFMQILTALIDEQEIFTYMHEGTDSIVYTHNEKQFSMTFWVTNE